jgi:FKBP-type peptidyl-prolyl cis-trans isomerase
MQKFVKKAGLWQWMLALCCIVALGSCKDGYEDPFDAVAQAKWEDDVIKQYLEVNKITDYTRTASGLYYVKREEGTGAKPVAGQTVEVNYVGKTVLESYKFDSSYDRAQTFKFTLGQRRVILGWEEGIPLMRKGEKALLLIPSHLAYGRTGSGNIQPNVPIMFDIHLIDFN